MSYKLIFVSIFIVLSCLSKHDSELESFATKNVVEDDKYFFVVNSKNDTVVKLRREKYFACFGDKVENFLVVAPKERAGFWAIDFRENYLFEVYNTTDGEPSPDELNFGMIRTVDENGRIGFANEKGESVIQPQFEQVTSFNHNYAIIGENCKRIPWDSKHEEVGCAHYSIGCSRNGYIDKKGNIIELGNAKLEELRNRLRFPNDTN